MNAYAIPASSAKPVMKTMSTGRTRRPGRNRSSKSTAGLSTVAKNNATTTHERILAIAPRKTYARYVITTAAITAQIVRHGTGVRAAGGVGIIAGQRIQRRVRTAVTLS